MKKIILILLFFVVKHAYIDADLWDKFKSPSYEARTKVWWFHGETETTEEGIDADLEAFREAGIGGVVFYDQVHGEAKGAFDSMSTSWWSSLKHAARKAKEKGLSFEVAASNGYVAGGPWITPDLGMQKIDVIDTIITLEQEETLTIDLSHRDPNFKEIATLIFPDSINFEKLALQPASISVSDNEEAIFTIDAGCPKDVSAISYTVNPRGKGSTGSMNIPGKPQERYFGAFYTDLPPIGTFEYSLDGEEWLQSIELPAIESVIGHKSRERTVSFPAVRGRWFRVKIHDWMDADGKFNKLLIENLQLSTRDLIDNWQVKSGLRTEVMYAHAEGCERGSIPKESIKNVTQHTDETGKLNMSLGPGCWHILRIGHVPTYARTKHGRRNLSGLEADVMSSKAATLQYQNYFKTICDTLRASGSNVQGMCMDSHEAGIQNWTSGFERRFAQTRGYELIPWLPVMAGYIVNSREESENVLRDFRRTIAETIASDFYGTLAKLCREDSVIFTTQAMLNILNDNILSRSVADKPQGEFWEYQTDGNYDCLDAASAAHLYGRPIASSEAFTDTPYSTTWDELLRIANLAYCRGINEFAVCASSYQPCIDYKYYDSASLHPYVFHRHHPNWSSVGPFWNYQARCSTLLREGEPVVDLCIYIGEEFPSKTFAYKLPVIPEGYNFDVCTYDALMNRFSASGGELTVKGGMRYKALVVEDRSYYSPEALQKIIELKREGVPVIRCDQGEDVEEILQQFGISPDVYVDYGTNWKGVGMANITEGRMCFFHRRAQDADIYFLYNHSEEPFSGQVRLRTQYTSSELWNPKDGTRKKVDMNEDKSIEVDLKPYESTFIVIE